MNLASVLLEGNPEQLTRLFSMVTSAELEAAQCILQSASEKGISVTTLLEQAYPSRLRHINAPPLVLFSTGGGELAAHFDTCSKVVAVVGSRAATGYGLSIAERLGEELRAAGFSVVSGFALGIDAAAQRGAISASSPTRGGPGVAVLGSGLNQFYPRQNRRLKEAWEVAGGLTLSEYTPETRPTRWTFPERNRIIAGLCDAVIVVEARGRSGALITARCAGEYGRDVWAVPGPITSAKSSGSNKLISDGAYLLTSIEDFLSFYGGEREERAPTTGKLMLEGLELHIYRHLRDTGELGVDELCVLTREHIPLVTRALFNLEDAGQVASDAGGRYRVVAGG